MFTALVLLFVLGGISVMTTTRESRAEAGRRLARWNPLFIGLLLLGLLIIFWPFYPPQSQQPWPYGPCKVTDANGQCVK